MLWWVGQNLVVTALLAGVVWIVCKTTRIGPAARHALWLVVLIKIVTPPFVVWPWGVPDLLAAFEMRSSVYGDAATPVVAYEPTHIEHAESFAPEVEPGNILEKPLSPVVVDSIAISSEYIPVAEATCPEPTSVEVTPPPVSQRLSNSQDVQRTASVPIPTIHQNWSALFLQVGGTVWLIGAVLFAMVQAIRIVRMSLRLRGAGQPDESVAKQIATLTKRLQLRPIEARLVRGIGSPFIWAFARPRLLWPAELPAVLPQTALQGLIVHELAHVKRRDHWVGWLELVAGCFWWWNPLFWYVRHQLRENAELACDAWVVGTLPAGRRAYAEALLAVCESVSKLTAPIPAVGATASGRYAIERRLNMILRGTSPFRLSRGGLLAALVFAATALPAWSQRSQFTSSYEPGTRIAGISNNTSEGAEVLALLDKYQQQEAAAREAALQQANERRQTLIDNLQALQDKYAREGKFDEAVAVREQIRRLQPQQLTNSISIDTFPGAISTSQPASPYLHRDRVGQMLSFEVVGSTNGRVWGSGIYSDDSDVGTAAVHAGILQPGEQGTVRVILGGPQDSFESSTHNGITTSSYGSFQGSFAFVPTDPPSDPHTLYEYRDRVGQLLSFKVTGSTEGTVWGSHVYTDDSPLGTAAVHAGILQPGQEGVVYVLIVPGHESYNGSTQNGVTTQDYQSYGGSYRFFSLPVAPGAYSPMRVDMVPGNSPAYRAVPGQTAQPLLAPGDDYNLPRKNPLTLSYPPAGETSPEGGFGGAIAVDSFGGSQLMQYRDRVGETISIPVVGSTSGAVWGSDVYTDDSSIEAAAVHAGVLSPGESGTLRVKILPGRESYEGTTGNGVTTHDYGAWEGSFQFEPSEKSSSSRDNRLKTREPKYYAGSGTRPFNPSSKNTPAVDSAPPVSKRWLIPQDLPSSSTEPPNVLSGRKVGESFEVLVRGATDGSVWGDKVYTDDSSIATAAVHLGLLKEGENGVVRVTMLEGKPEYEGTSRNGVTSRPWKEWERSFCLDPVEKVFVPQTPSLNR